jgi:uncharacterized protein GlcG (DUF336 family)
LALALLASACGGGGGGGGGSASGFLGGSGDPTVINLRNCDGTCSNMALSQSHVATVVQQAVDEMQARSIAGGTIAVVDRVGNALAVFEFGSPPQTVTIGSNPASVAFPGNGLEDVPGGRDAGTADTAAALGDPALLLQGPISARFAALSKAGTAAYLSTQGNAFTTRTASQIIQENFNPGEMMQTSGPLFGVQFSQLPCSDFARRAFFMTGPGMSQMRAGPKRLPLGFAGDSGGVPLYIAGDVVGAVGIEINGIYTVDRTTVDVDQDIEEVVALAAQRSFEPITDREARFISVIGKFLRYTDVRPSIAAAPRAALVSAVTGATPVDVLGFYRAADGILAGVTFLNAESGYARAADYFGSGPVRILVRGDAPTMPYMSTTIVDPGVNQDLVAIQLAATNPRDSFSPLLDDGGLTMQEAATIVANGILVAKKSRAQIRRGIAGPGRPFMEVNVSVVDLMGNLLAQAGTEDAPVFGTDVSVQKGRTAAFFSRPPNGADPRVTTSAADDLLADVEIADPLGLGVAFQTQPIGRYVTDLRSFLGRPAALADGIAFADRSVGNLARPFFPDGINGNPAGPLSRPIASWSPFNNGIQLDLILNRLLIGLLGDPAGVLGTPDEVFQCTNSRLVELRGGGQIFPGSVPIFKNGVLVGGMGVSGDGVDQDDLISFEGVKQGGIALGGNGVGGPGMVGNAPPAIRSDTLSVSVPGGDRVNLRYVNCPPSPFINSTEQNVCGG